MSGLAEQIACLKRELRIRERVYPSWVQRGTMKPEAMARELAGMRGALDTLERLREPWDGRDRRRQPELDLGSPTAYAVRLEGNLNDILVWAPSKDGPVGLGKVVFYRELFAGPIKASEGRPG